MAKRSLIASVAMCVPPALAEHQQGSWDPEPFDFGPVNGPFTRAINLVHVWDGTTTKVLSLSADYPDSRLWTPPPVGSPPGYSGIFEPADLDPEYLFCGGHSALADGRMLHVGGYYVDDAHLFDPWLPVGDQWNNPFAPCDMASHVMVGP